MIADTTIGRAGETAACADKFRKEGVSITLTVTPCWCYGTETFDMDPKTIKAVWGFNGTDARARCIWQRDGSPCPAGPARIFHLRARRAGRVGYDDPRRRGRKDSSFCALRRGRGLDEKQGYVNLGGVAMGIAGSFCDAELFQKYFGMRAEWVDMTEIVRRITLGIYDAEEYERALAG